MAEVGSMQDEARKRKERLLSMKRKGTSTGIQDDNEPSEKVQAEDGSEKLPKPVFRSYKPMDEQLKENTLPTADPVEVVGQVSEQLKAGVPQPTVEEVDLATLAPRKPDWDLKRDIAKKLEKLEKRTQRAIAELIRERLQTGESDLATAVNANADAGPQDDEDDD
ncbi:unnamed protein product [Owenia fusiformis]|uniref:Coiled-coil domain-containing protein 12 n=1 Tax=Owenia fusiformis TaxID=6347 RepID=A0A8S4N124_OWEFU|nr:unnamed protein product [Owenia fusiformis]